MVPKEICFEAQMYTGSLESFSCDVNWPTVLICDEAREARRQNEFLKHLSTEFGYLNENYKKNGTPFHSR